MSERPKITIYKGDNLAVLKTIPDESINLIYIDPPFNTGKVQERRSLKTVQDDIDGDRTGYQGKRYRSIEVSHYGYNDKFEDYMEFLKPRLDEAYRVLTSNGSLFFHIDYRESHYCKIFLDSLFGRNSLINDIIWSYDYGARSTKKWSTKHDNIFWYAKNPKDYVFNYDAIDRIPYLAPALVGDEKAKRGKTPTDVWWNSVVPTNGKEKTGYPTQKPLGILTRIVTVHSNKGDTLLDFFAGSGSFGEAAFKHKRYSILVDSNPDAINVMKKRFSGLCKPKFVTIT